MIQGVPAYEVLCHRMAWSFFFMVLILTLKQQWYWIKTALKNPKTWLTYGITATVLGVNWFTYIWAVGAGYIVESSLGYFINPLFNVLLGVIFLKERLRTWQWLAIGVATIGVIYLTIDYGRLPWVALTLTLTFGIYALLHKTAKLNSIESISLEMSILIIPALFLLLQLEFNHEGAFGHIDWKTTILLILTGAVTVTPLLLFASAARKITLTNLGILQYIAPTLQFLIGVLVYHENFPVSRLIGFSIIWFSLIIYSFEGILFHRQQKKAERRPLAFIN